MHRPTQERTTTQTTPWNVLKSLRAAACIIPDEDVIPDLRLSRITRVSPSSDSFGSPFSPTSAWTETTQTSSTTVTPISSMMDEHQCEQEETTEKLAQANQIIAELRAELQAVQEENKRQRDVYEEEQKHTALIIPSEQIKKQQQLGSGSFSNVWMALYTNQQHEQQVAIKEWSDSPPGREEVDIHIQLAHENVLRVIGIVTFPLFSFVLELAEGSLLDRLKAYQSGQLAYPYEARLETAIFLARGLCYLHDVAKVALRDIKPENVLCVNGKPKWADFGLAARVDDQGRAIATNHDVGTLGYAAPEQMRTLRPSISGTKSDIFAFGRLLHELFYGVPMNLSKQDSLHISRNGAVYTELPYSSPSKVSHLDSRVAFFATIKNCGRYSSSLRPAATQVAEELTRAMALCTP